MPQAYIESMLDAGLNQAEIVQLLDRGFIAQYSSLFATSAANPHGEEMVGVIASMAWANISPNMIASKHLLDDAHLQVYAEKLDAAYESGQYVSIGDIASLYAANVPIAQLDQLLADQFFSTYGDLIEIYGAGWLAKIKLAHPQICQRYYQQLEAIEDIPGAPRLAQTLAQGNLGSPYELAWDAAHTDQLAAVALTADDGRQGPDALLIDGSVIELKDVSWYQYFDSDVSGSNGVPVTQPPFVYPKNQTRWEQEEKELVAQERRHIAFAQAHGCPIVVYSFNSANGPIPDDLRDLLLHPTDANGNPIAPPPTIEIQSWP